MADAYVHPQSAWELPTQKISGPAPLGTPGTWVIHYPGGGGYEPMTDAQVIQALRAGQNSYLDRRGYSLGYSALVSQSGSAWAGRGLEGHPGHRVYNPASNPGRKVDGNFNHVSRSLQIMVGFAQPASAAAVAKVNAIIATQPTWDVRVHVDVDFTQCAGAGVIGQVRTGVIGQQGTVITPPVKLPGITGYSPSDSWGLFPLDKNKPVQKVGAYDTDKTRYLQDVIFYYGGGNILVDGKFGDKTKERVEDIQALFGFPESYVDGVVGWSTSKPEYSTWSLFDYLVTLNKAPEPAPPVDLPPTSGVESADPVSWYIVKGDTPWGVSADVYGNGNQNDKLDHAAFSSYSTPNYPVFVTTPGIAGTKTYVLDGEGPLAMMRRLVDDPAYPSAKLQETFYDWNGGWERNFLKGDLVYLPEGDY